MKETEYKFLVERDKFYEILTLIKNRYTEAEYKEVIQINYYYDTDDNYLLANHTTLRVRQTERSLRLELKESQQLTGNERGGAEGGSHPAHQIDILQQKPTPFFSLVQTIY